MDDDHDELDVDFDFRSMLSNIDDPNSLSLDLLSPPPPQPAVKVGGPPLHPGQTRQQQTLSMSEMLDSRLFKADAPWIGSTRQGGLTAAPPPSSFNAGGARGNRSGSGAIISTRLRAASDMFQQGFLTSDEKSLMKDLILSKNQRFKEEYTNAERSGNWVQLQQYLRSFGSRPSPANSLSFVMEELASEFEALATPPPPLPASSSSGAQHYGGLFSESGGMTKAVRKRMASQSTPVARPKKTTSSTKKEGSTAAGASSSAMKTRSSAVVEEDVKPTPVKAAEEKPQRSTKPIAAMDDKELEIEAAIAAAEGDNEAVAKIRKNERERRRRLAVSNGFDELFELLKLPQAAQIDKVSILRKAIDRIKELEGRVKELEEQAGGSQDGAEDEEEANGDEE